MERHSRSCMCPLSGLEWKVGGNRKPAAQRGQRGSPDWVRPSCSLRVSSGASEEAGWGSRHRRGGFLGSET